MTRRQRHDHHRSDSSVQSSANGTLINTATVTANEPDPNAANTSSTENTEVNRQVDLSVTKTGSPDPVNPGGQIVYLLEVTNNGPSVTVGGVTLTDNLPRPSLFMAALDQAQEAAPTGSAATGAGSFTLNGSHTLLGFEITVDTAALSGTITAAHIHSAAPGVDGPPVRTLSFSGGTSAGVWTSEDSEPLKPTLVDELLSGNLYVNVHTGANPGGEIRGQIVTNTAAAGITFVSANASQGAGCSETNGVVTCGLGDLLGGASATVTIVVAVDPTTLEGTVLTNFAIVTSAAVDTDPANDSATTTTTVRAPILVCGDLHPPGGGDGDVDILDALRVLNAAVGNVTITSCGGPAA